MAVKTGHKYLCPNIMVLQENNTFSSVPNCFDINRLNSFNGLGEVSLYVD